MTREEQFLSDYRKLRAWAEQSQLRLRNHTSLKRVAHQTGPSNWPQIVGEIGPLENADALLVANESEVFVMLGSQFGSGIPLNHAVMDNRKVAFAQMSVLSGHYVGVAVYTIEKGKMVGPALKFSSEATDPK
jgi:hypothetical protein